MAVGIGWRPRVAVGAGFAVMALLLATPHPAHSQPAIHRQVEPLGPWIAIVDNPSTADSAWTGLAALMPALPDSVRRGFGWYLMYSAAQALGRPDSMRAAAESSYAYKPTDPSGFRDFSRYLSRSGVHLDWAETYALRTLESEGAPEQKPQWIDDLRWLGYIQLRRDEDSAATATFERYLELSNAPNAWTLYRLGELHARHGRDALAIDRLTAGLSAFPQDSADAAKSSTLLDSLVTAAGGNGRERLSRIARARDAAKQIYYLDSHRDGRRAPKAPLEELRSGRAVSPAANPGITVVYGWATWCGPCRRSMPVLQEWAAAPRTKPVRVITIDAEGGPVTETRAMLKRFVNEHDVSLPVFMADSAAAARWGLNSFPITLVVEKGRIVYRGHAGGPADVVDGLEAELESLGSRRRPGH